MSRQLQYVALFLFGSAAICWSQTAKVVVTNPADFDRHSETISVPWGTLVKLLPDLNAERISVTQESDGRELLHQVFDPQLASSSFELLFQSDFKPNETKAFIIRTLSGRVNPDSSLVDARFVKPREDLAWENDRIAFRMYGPALAAEVSNGVDVWTKRVRYRIVKKWYEGEELTPKVVYHIDHGEGADFFNVGRSLGCGGSGVWVGGKVHQPGVFASYKIVSTGPIRACFELSYNSWNVNQKHFKETKRITLDAGQSLNRIDVKFTGADNAPVETIACGLVKRPGTKLYKNDELSRMSLWGLTTDSPVDGYLGMAVILDSRGFAGWAEDSSQYIALGKMNDQNAFSYFAGAGWTRSGDFNSAEDWNGYVDHVALALRSPLRISILRGE